MNNDVLTIAEAAAYLRLHPKTVARMARQGALPCYRNGRIVRFSRQALQRHLGMTDT